MDSPALSHASTLLARADPSGRPPVYKAIGISLAVASGIFIGISFVLKKIGLLKANVKYNEEAGEGYGYLKNVWWWTGMTLMIVGEICNFVAYAFVDAILVTPLGALSVVITTILSAIFLKERLSFVGKVGCFSCIIGSVVIAMNAPEQSSVSNIQEMQHFVISPGFLTYAGLIIVGSVFTALWAGPRYGKKSMFVYISICSMVGGLSVVATQGLGSAILAQINGEPQFKQWFLYVLFVFVVGTLLTEIIYLNKALNIFNAALVTPTYYVFFTSATIVTSAVLFQGFKGSATQITTVILGFLQICSGVVLLQLSKSAKDVPDAAVFKGDLDQIREVATQEDPEYEPKADSIRGTASIVRRLSTPRRHLEAEEARRFVHDRQEDSLKPPGENEIIEWDGIRRRKTLLGEGPTMSRPHTPRSPSIKQQLPPLGMSRLPDPEEEDHRPSTKHSGHSFFSDIRSRAESTLHPHWLPLHEQEKHLSDATDTDHGGLGITGRQRSDTPRSISWADEKVNDQDSQSTAHPQHRQFSFGAMFNRIRPSRSPSPKRPNTPPRGILRRTQVVPGGDLRRTATEEERLGLVHGDSRSAQPEGMDEKLERWSSSEESDLAEDQPIPAARPHGDSVSTMSTAAFPPFEDYSALYSAQAPAPLNLELELAPGQIPPMPARRHPLNPPSLPTATRTPSPPLPDEQALTTDPSDVRAISGSSDMGVSSLASDDSHDSPPPYPTRRQSGWRRHMSEASSDDEFGRDHRGFT
ncbi:hypothetical protein N7512_005760 [Penicillium capsulatum]|nr:hypothetical protein N7512_005760 [Penicillium capsulatum]